MWNVPADAQSSWDRLLWRNRANMAEGRRPETWGANVLYYRAPRISVELPWCLGPWNCVLRRDNSMTQTIIQDTSMFTIYSVILQSRYQLGKLWSNKEIDYFFSLVQEISLHCLQATRALVLGLSWQECEGRASILRSEQDPRHIPCRLWVFLHMVKATKPVKYIGQPFVKAVQTWKQS